MKVPFLDVAAATAELAEELDAAWVRVRTAGWFVRGPELEAFEAEWAAYVGARHAVGVANGLDALSLALRAADVGPGDEVLVPSHTFVATWLAVTAVGATPVPVEPEPNGFLMDLSAATAAATPRTRAAIAVHLYGEPFDAGALRAALPGVIVIEDAAQAQGAEVRGRRVGSLGHAAGTSLYPGKNLGALGDGGIVTTDDEAIAARVRRLGNYGQTQRYHHDEAGTNSRLDELQAAFLRVKLRHLDAWNARRAQVAARYHEGLAGLDLVRPGHAPGQVWHLYVVRVRDRDRLHTALAGDGVATQIHYPIACHRSGAYRDLATRPLRRAEALADSVLSLPIGPHLSEQAVDTVIDRLRAHCRG
jgi:dTDP-3-amino-3,4,6-trideoxy-alpha-D-glucose transaminase